ncbi:MAG: PPC domain-containing protein [Verrucomicrobiota bacterium]
MKHIFAFLFLSSIAWAQLPTTDLHSINPRVAKAGETVSVTLSGSNLDGVTALHFTEPRIQAKPVLKAVEELVPNPKPVPSQFEITVPKDVPPGIYEVRTVGHFGLSTARPFVVAAKDSIELQEEGDHSTQEKALDLPIDATMNAKIDARAIDWYRFEAQKDERLLIRVWAEQLDSKMNAQLKIYNEAGLEIGRSYLSEGRDPLADFSAPEGGTYFLAVSDVLYRGDTNHFYRLQISKGPHLDFVHPPVAEPGTRAKFTIYGRNLPGGSLDSNVRKNGHPLETVEVEIDVPAEISAPVVFSGAKPTQAAARGFDYKLGDSNPVRIGFATAPTVSEDAAADVQIVELPCEIMGRFDEPSDMDVFRFEGVKDKTYWIDVVSDRLKAPTDAFVFVEKVGVEETMKIGENDQKRTYFSVDNLDATNVDANDPGMSFTADEDAEYQVTLINHYGGGGADHMYRLAIREAVPDFELFALYERPLANGRAGWPSTPVLRKGGTVAVRIVAPRQDGFDGEIAVSATSLPPGVTVHPLKMHGRVDEGFLVFEAADDAAVWTGTIQIVGKAIVGDAEVARQARSTSLVWGVVFADAFRVRTKLDLETVLSVCDEVMPAKLAPAEDKPYTVEIGQKLQIPIKAEILADRKGNLTVQPHKLFGMIRNPPTVNLAGDATEGTLEINFTKNGNYDLEPGTYQFSLLGTGVSPYEHFAPGTELAAAELKRLEELVPVVAKELADANAAKAQKQAALDEAKKNAAAASPEAKPDLEKRVAEAQVLLDEAIKDSAAAEAKYKRAEQLKTEATNAAKSAADKAKAKDTKFAVYSKPITVTVTPKPEPKK